MTPDETPEQTMGHLIRRQMADRRERDRLIVFGGDADASGTYDDDAMTEQR